MNNSKETTVAKKPVPAPSEIVDIFNKVKQTHHSRRLEKAQIAVMLKEDKAFRKGRFNFGKVTKCSPLYQVLLENSSTPCDFVVVIPEQSWEFLTEVRQKEAFVDLYLTRCSLEYEAVTEPDPKKEGKERPKKDKWGRIEYTDNPKYDEDGNVKWLVLPLDVETLTDNVSRYGTWCEVFRDFKAAVVDSQHKSA